MINYILIKRVIKRLYSQLLGKHLNKIKNGQGERPYYAYCIQKAAQLASNLGHEKMSIIEFGVAGGAGLLSIEKHCELIKNHVNIDFEVYGFDMETGLPEPVDYRDEPYKWSGGFYKMDREKLESKLTFSKLIIGDVEETLKKYGTACVPNMKCSKMVRKLFTTPDENIIVECSFNKRFKKWEPIKEIPGGNVSNIKLLD